MLNQSPELHILMLKAVLLTTCIVRKFLAEQWIRCAWSVNPYSFENVYRGELQITNADTADLYDELGCLKSCRKQQTTWQSVEIGVKSCFES